MSRSAIRIANCSGFYGDRLSAAREMVDGGPIDALTGDWLAELTMLILARTRAKRAGAGYASTFLEQIEQVIGACLDQDIKIVSNAGGLDPESCAEEVVAVADSLGLTPRVAYVNGDNLLARLEELKQSGVDIIDLETGQPITERSYISANAYLGAWGIVEALKLGADVVVTGRTTDAAVVAGPAAWFHRWSRDDWDAMAGAVAAGHVIECGTQATGGNFSFFTEIPGLKRVGFPIAEIEADGSAVITKHPDSGGAVTVETVTSQLLYEIGPPGYVGPDVTARFDTLSLSQQGPDRVRITGTKGERPPSTLKVSMNSWGGFRSDIVLALTGLDIEAKADLLESAFWASVPLPPEAFDSVTIELVQTAHADPASNEAATAQWRMTLKDLDKQKMLALAAGVNDLALATIPGFYSLAGTAFGKPFGVHTSGLVPAEQVPQHVVVIGGERSSVASVAPPGGEAVEVPEVISEPVPDGHTKRVPLGTILGSRSGDKGPNANLGVFARSAEAFAWMAEELTTERLRELLPEAADLEIERYELPNLWSLNFIIFGFLQQGVAASTRQDPQAKSLGEWLRARHADIPVSLLAQSDLPVQKLEMVDRLRAVTAPERVMSKDREASLSEREREILNGLGRLFEHGFVNVTMAQMAERLNCSLRTMYGLASSRTELVLLVTDRNLREIGRAAQQAISDEMTALEAVRAYLSAATIAVQNITPEFASDMASIPGGSALHEAHSEYLIRVTKTLLDLAEDQDEIEVQDTTAVARMIASLGREFSRPGVMPTLKTAPKDAADAMVDLVLAGMKKRSS